MNNKEFEKLISTDSNNGGKTVLTKATSIAIIILLVLAAMSGLFPPFAIGGIVIGGIILIISIYRKKVKYYGYAAIAIVIFCTVSFLFFALVIVPNTYSRGKWIKAHTVVYNFQKIGKALQKYADDHNGYLPTKENWCDVLLQYDKNLTQSDFKHPEKPGIILAFNKNLSSLRFSDIPKDTVLLFETQGGWNLSGDEDTIQTANSANAIVKVMPMNMEIKSYWVEYKGSNENWRGRFEPVRWKP